MKVVLMIVLMVLMALMGFMLIVKRHSSVGP